MFRLEIYSGKTIITTTTTTTAAAVTTTTTTITTTTATKGNSFFLGKPTLRLKALSNTKITKHKYCSQRKIAISLTYK